MAAPDGPDTRRMGNTLLFKAVDRGEPVAFIPPANAYHFTEGRLRFRKHADLVTPDETLTEKAKTVLDALDETTKRLSFDSYCVDYGYWWIELPGKTADIQPFRPDHAFLQRHRAAAPRRAAGAC